MERENTRSQAILVFSEKQSFRKLGDIIYQLNQSGEIYVRRDALTILFGNRIMYGNILTYGGEPLWTTLRLEGSFHYGLLYALRVASIVDYSTP